MRLRVSPMITLPRRARSIRHLQALHSLGVSPSVASYSPSSCAKRWIFSMHSTSILFGLKLIVLITTTRSRSLNWRFSLTIVVALVLVAIPLLQSYFLTHPSRTNGTCSLTRRKSGRLTRHLGTTFRRGLLVRLILTGIPFSIYVFLFNRIPLPPQETNTSRIL